MNHSLSRSISLPLPRGKKTLSIHAFGRLTWTWAWVYCAHVSRITNTDGLGKAAALKLAVAWL